MASTPDETHPEVAEMLRRWASYATASDDPAPSRDIAREKKRLRRFLSEERFARTRRHCQLRELPLASILPGIENVAVPLSAIHEESGHANHAEIPYVVATAHHRHAARIFEFGTFLGRTTAHLAASDPAAHVWTLDLPASQNPWRFASAVGSYFAGTPEAERITMIRKNAFEFDPSPFRGSMDFIWIDGDHSYEGVKNDTEKAFEMLSPGGAIMWHDFGHESPGLVDYFIEFTRSRALFRIRRTSVLLHVDGVDPLTFTAATVPFSKSMFKSQRG